MTRIPHYALRYVPHYALRYVPHDMMRIPHYALRCVHVRPRPTHGLGWHSLVPDALGDVPHYRMCDDGVLRDYIIYNHIYK